MPRSLDSDHSPPSQHISIDLTSDAPAPLLPPPRPAAPYPPHLPSPRGNNSFDWDRFPTPSVQTSSSRSTSTSSSYRQDPPLASVASSSTSNGDVEADDEERDALELSSVAQGKQRASDLYGEVEGAATDSLEDDGQPMLGGRSSAMGSRRTPKGQRAKAATAARRRKLVVGFSMIAGLLVVLSVAGRDRIPRDWRFERWRSSSAPSSGGNGSSVRMEDGTEFIYRNDFGGIWNSTPFSTAAIAQGNTPPLSQHWDYSTQRIYGVNLGGWLTLEPFITPALFEPFLNASKPAVDEWTLSENLGDRLASVIEEHYATFITEQDFARIAGAGLNWVRIAVPFWAIEVQEGEPFLAYVSWKYFLKAMTWARKYGLRINLDLHTAPGSQNGWNHSGKSGPVGFLNGAMGVANAQRTLNIIRALAEFLSLPENAEVVLMASVLNEPFMEQIGSFALRSFYFEAYRTVRAASGLGEGHGPMITFHDGFKGTARWYGFLPGSDRVALDSHRYLAFRDPNLDPMDLQALKPCANWATDFNRTMAQVGVAMTGEWSVAVNDCGRFLNGVGLGTRFEGTFPSASDPNGPGASPVGGCEKWEDYMSWDDELKIGLKQVALAHMDAFQNWFYWTWKTSNSLLSPNTSLPSNPIWSYSLGLEHGYIPSDPRASVGFCDANAKAHDAPPPKRFRFNRPLYDWQMGRGPVEELGQVNTTKADAEGWGTFPPEWVGRGEARLRTEELPRLVRGEGRAGAIKLEGPRPEGAVDLGVRRGNGWWVEQEGCDYLSPWEGVGAEVPKGTCSSW